MTQTSTRKSAQVRREEILDAAFTEFAKGGFHGTSTDAIARAAGVSQPYLFRLFGTKKDLFIATVKQCFGSMLALFTETAAKVPADEDVFEAMGKAYVGMLRDRRRLLVQMHAYTACDDPEICEVVREGFAELWRTVARLSGKPGEEVRKFFAMGMLINVSALMNLLAVDEAWARDCIGELIDPS